MSEFLKQWDAQMPNMPRNKKFLRKNLDDFKANNNIESAENMISVMKLIAIAEPLINEHKEILLAFKKLNEEYMALKKAHDIANYKYLELVGILKKQQELMVEESKDMADFAQGKFGEACIIMKPKHFTKINW